MGLNERSIFKQMLIEYSNNPSLENISREFQQLSIDIAPHLLYRYRKCIPRHLSELENEVLAFSAPAVYEDDPDDAYVTLSHDRIADMKSLATGEFLPFFSALMETSLEDCSRSLSEVFFSGDPISNMFEGVIPPQHTWRNDSFAGMSDNDKAHCLSEAFAGIVNVISERDACSQIRKETKVTCLCERSDSRKMWDEYAEEGTGFQVAYKKESLFGIGSLGVTLPLIFPVIYEEERPDMSELAMMIALRDAGFAFLPGDTPIQRYWLACALKAIYIKGKKLFSHEEEWRIVIPDQTVNETHRLYAARLCPIEYIKLGERVSAKNEEALRDIAEKINVPVLRYCE